MKSFDLCAALIIPILFIPESTPAGNRERCLLACEGNYNCEDDCESKIELPPNLVLVSTCDIFASRPIPANGDSCKSECLLDCGSNPDCQDSCEIAVDLILAARAPAPMNALPANMRGLSHCESLFISTSQGAGHILATKCADQCTQSCGSNFACIDDCAAGIQAILAKITPGKIGILPEPTDKWCASARRHIPIGVPCPACPTGTFEKKGKCVLEPNFGPHKP